MWATEGFHWTDVISSSLDERGPVEWVLSGLVRSNTWSYGIRARAGGQFRQDARSRVRLRSLTSAFTAPLAKRFCCFGLKSRPRTGPVWTSFLKTRASDALSIIQGCQLLARYSQLLVFLETKGRRKRLYLRDSLGTVQNLVRVPDRDFSRLHTRS